MSDWGPGRPIKGCHNYFLLLTVIVFALVAATAVYLFSFTNMASLPRSVKPTKAKNSNTRLLQSFHPEKKEWEDVNGFRFPPLLEHVEAETMYEQSPFVQTDGNRITPTVFELNSKELKSDKSTLCQSPTGGFKAWKSGLVTVLEPVIPKTDCKKLMNGDKVETRRVQTASKQWKNPMTDTMFLKQTRDCNHLQETFNNNLYNTILEQNFPIAFIFVVNSSPQQVLRLLKLLYRPQNVFCIHYDVKTPRSVRQAFDNIAKCFSNVVIATKLENVIWGYYTIMQAQMNCLSDLHRHREGQPAALKWRYVINLCGKELPLVTNRELVSRLMTLLGSSSVSASVISKEEMKKRIQLKAVVDKKRGKAVTSSIRLDPPPFGIKMYKGSSYNAFSYAFVHTILTNSTIQTIYKFFVNCKNAEEHFYASVYMMPGVPGGYKPQLHRHYFEVAKAIWCFDGRKCQDGVYCHGRVLHTVCIANSADLPSIVKNLTVSTYMFHNKYFAEMDHTVMDCLEERIVDKNREEYRQECGASSG